MVVETGRSPAGWVDQSAIRTMKRGDDVALDRILCRSALISTFSGSYAGMARTG